MTQIDRNLNVVITIDRNEGPLFIHAAPISYDVFKTYFLVLSKTFSAIFGQGLAVIAGPRIAAMMLEDVAKTTGVWEGPAGVRFGLMAEVRRLANVVLPAQTGGWQTLPYQHCLDRGMITPEDASEVEGSLVFFSLVRRVNKQAHQPQMLAAMNDLWGTRNTSSGLTEFCNSLQISTVIENTGGTAAA